MRSRAYAAILAVSYAVASTVYILVSTHLAADVAESVEDMESTELTKGVLFVLVTGLGLFFLALFLMRRLERTERRSAEHAEALLVAQRRALAGRLAGSAAHDFNNVLAVAGGNVELLSMQDCTSQRAQERVARVRESIADGVRLAQRLSRLGRAPKASPPTAVELVAHVRECLEMLAVDRHVKACTIQVVADEPVSVVASPGHLELAFSSLVLNAAEAAGPSGRVEIRVTRDGAGARVEVHDSGPGIADDVRGRLFDEFFSTKENASGLGLVSARLALASGGGEIACDRSPLGGACVRVLLPAKP